MKRKFLLGSTVGLVLTLVLSGCSQPAAPQKSANEVIREGLNQLSLAASYRFEAALKFDMNGPAGKPPAKVLVDMNVNGGVDGKDKQDPRFFIQADLNGSADKDSGSGSVDVRFDKGVLYGNILKFEIPSVNLPKEMVNQYIGKWWKLTLPEVMRKQLTENLLQADDANMTPQQKQLRDLFNSTNFFTNLTYVGADSIKGESSYHYKGDLDRKATVDFSKKAAEIQGKPMIETDVQKLESILANTTVVGDIWVGATSGVFNQMNADVKLEVSGTQPSGTMNFRFTFSDFDKALTVEAPQGATEFPVEQILGAFLGGDVDPALDGSLSEETILVPPIDIPPTTDSTSSANVTGVVISGGKAMLMMKDGSFAPLTTEFTLTNGSKIDSKGKVTMPDGKSAQMKEGESLMKEAQVMFIGGEMFTVE